MKKLIFRLVGISGIVIACSFVSFGQQDDKKKPVPKPTPPVIIPGEKEKPKPKPKPPMVSKSLQAKGN